MKQSCPKINFCLSLLIVGAACGPDYSHNATSDDAGLSVQFDDAFVNFYALESDYIAYLCGCSTDAEAPPMCADTPDEQERDTRQRCAVHALDNLQVAREELECMTQIFSDIYACAAQGNCEMSINHDCWAGANAQLDSCIQGEKSVFEMVDAVCADPEQSELRPPYPQEEWYLERYFSVATVFICDNGTFEIPNRWVCDGWPDCDDETDELGCD